MIQKDKEPKNVTDRVKANLSFLLSSEVTTVEMCVLFLSHIWTMCVYVCVCVYVSFSNLLLTFSIQYYVFKI